MSGRPARNCKRRSAAEMLGISTSPAAAGSPTKGKRGATSDSPVKGNKKQKVADVEAEAMETSPQVEKQQSPKPTRGTRGRKPAATSAEPPAASSKVSEKPTVAGNRNTSPKKAAKNSSPPKQVQPKTPVRATRGRKAAAAKAVDQAEDLVEENPVADEEPATGSAEEPQQLEEEPPEQMEDIAANETQQLEELQESTVEETQEAAESQQITEEAAPAAEELEQADTTAEPQPEQTEEQQQPGEMEEEYGEEMRLIDPQDVNEPESQLIIQESSESQQVEIINIDGKEYNVTRVSALSSDVTTTIPPTHKPVTVVAVPPAQPPAKVPLLITVQKVNSADKVKQIAAAASLKALKPSTVTAPPTAADLVVKQQQRSSSASSTGAATTATNKPPPITKTYVLGKGGKIEELLTKPASLPTSKPALTVNSIVSEAAPSLKTITSTVFTATTKSGESDDDEFECEEEEERLKLEGYGTIEEGLLLDTTNESIPDDTLKTVFDAIEPTDCIENYSTYTEDDQYKCNLCTDSDVLAENRTDLIKHIKAEHKADLNLWVCPLCKFSCVYRLSLMLHLSIHSNNKPYTCDLCNRQFVYKHQLEVHQKFHNDVRDLSCSDCILKFVRPESLKAHKERIHKIPRSGRMPGASAITLSERTTLDEAIKLLTGGDDTTSTDGSNVLTIQKDSIKISDIGGEDSQDSTLSLSASADDHSNLVVTDSDLIGNPDSLVQIMPVSFRNENGIPETINVVITVPNQKKPNAVAIEKVKTLFDNNYYPSTGRKLTVDEELLPYCEVLSKPILFNNTRAFIKCTVCPTDTSGYFGSVTQFCEHLRKDHADKNIKPYKCTECKYTCRVKGNLDQHIKFHATERPFVCPICHKGFIQKYKLNLHLKFHENKRDWQCSKCGSAFNDKQDLSRHMKNVHFDPDNGVKCPYCERVFKNDYMLEQHIHVHTGEKNYKCDICGKVYSTRESLRSHMKGHQFQFGCEICAKPLGSYSAFIAHKRLHDPNQKGFQCEICGKVLLFKATLEAHMRSVHSEDRSFACEQCHKSFKTQAQLNNHMISHTKDKPYSCHVCGYAVKRKDSLRQHMYRHAEVKPYRCGRCGKEYTQKQALEIHLKSKHAGVTTFNCTMCEKGFNTNYLLKKHMQKAHSIEMTEKMPRSEQIIIAQQQMDEVAESEPPATNEEGVLPPVAKKQTVLINAHICEHCQEVFVSQHALAVHILSEHMNQRVVSGGDEAANIPTNAEDGQIVNISETVEIPIGEEMVLVQSVEPSTMVEDQDGNKEMQTIVIETSINSVKPEASILSQSTVVATTSDGEATSAAEADESTEEASATQGDEQMVTMEVTEIVAAEVEAQ